MGEILFGFAVLLPVAWIAVLVVCVQKGKPGMAVLGIFPGPFAIAVIGALRIAKPNSTWATRHYDPDGEKMRRARNRWPRLSPQGEAASA